jgi:two-component system, OmpR family, phosphate regulon response regulator PhoB
MQSLLVIDDEPDVADLLDLNLRKHGQYAISVAMDGAVGLRKAREQDPRLIVLDLMLPGMSGFDLCRVLKSDRSTRHIPILVLSARVEVADRIRCFELGADDYVTKPFSPRETTLRIHSLASRNREMSNQQWVAGDIRVNTSRHEVSVSGKIIHPTGIEFRLLTHLIEARGRVQSRDRLLSEVWGYSHALTTRTVETHMQRLRKKLGKAGSIIQTVRSYGYRMLEEQVRLRPSPQAR